MKEITERDKFGTSDFFGIFINGYNDGQQDFRFFVSTAGTQMDCLATESGEDYSWDGIWYSNVNLTDYGWTVEMKIPYAALRFSEQKEQIWGVNFFREIRRDRQKFTWNRIDNKIGNTITQAGILEGIQDIKPPTRLFLIPYSSYYINNNKANGTNTEFKAGMDIKYGINDSFTLDAILVPDFGQTAFDNVVLNLGPFEQQFNENRPFFTEGTDMFNKGSLLYSRRIGGSPSTSPDVGENEEIQQYPSRINLINAVKISGRTSKGLGIGVMNAVTEKAEATIRNSETGAIRSEVVEPLANYNILVLDQRFRKNSSVSVVNTSVIREGAFRDANVSAFLFDLNTKANTYNLSGNVKFSHVNDFDGNKNGYTAYLNFGKTSGNYRFSTNASYISDQYDINDLGIIFMTNYHNLTFNSSYRILNPNKTFNTFKISTITYTELENVTGKPQEASLEFNLETTDKKNHYFGAGFLVSPFETFDFYQPRKDGRYVYNPKY
ncbi:MAG: hydrolase, partial [Flavobacterium sp.]|nr:hydrolase [Flavobacterium sp.]